MDGIGLTLEITLRFQMSAVLCGRRLSALRMTRDRQNVYNGDQNGRLTGSPISIKTGRTTFLLLLTLGSL